MCVGCLQEVGLWNTAHSDSCMSGWWLCGLAIRVSGIDWWLSITAPCCFHVV